MSEKLYILFKICHILVAFSLCFGTVMFIAAMLLVPTGERLIYIALSLTFLVIWTYLSHRIEEMFHAEHRE